MTNNYFPVRLRHHGMPLLVRWPVVICVGLGTGGAICMAVVDEPDGTGFFINKVLCRCDHDGIMFANDTPSGIDGLLVMPPNPGLYIIGEANMFDPLVGNSGGPIVCAPAGIVKPRMAVVARIATRIRIPRLLPELP